jgi:hypothetical protein
MEQAEARSGARTGCPTSLLSERKEVSDTALQAWCCGSSNGKFHENREHLFVCLFIYLLQKLIHTFKKNSRRQNYFLSNHTNLPSIQPCVF